MSLSLQPVRVDTRSADTESYLVFADDLLVAVLVQLSDEYGTEAGRWFLEAGFGRIDDPYPPIFADLNEAQAWITSQLSE